jgi:hypothetical protein
MSNYLEKARAILAKLSTETLAAPCPACGCHLFWESQKNEWFCIGCFPTQCGSVQMREVIWGIDGIPAQWEIVSEERIMRLTQNSRIA